MIEPLLLHESVVTEDEIDTLGHLNVRFYVERAVKANLALLRRTGIVPAPAGQMMRRVDTYNRFHREQFTGATLHTYGGIVPNESVGVAAGVTTYLEIRNVDKGETAASFIMTSDIIDTASQARQGIKLPVADLLSLTIELPQAGHPRSLSLATPGQVSFAELDAVVPNDQEPGVFHGRREGTVKADDCDEQGRLKEELEPLFVLFRAFAEQQQRQPGPPIFMDKTGRRLGWAMIETRVTNEIRPTAGETIVSLSADLKFGEKWRHTRRWLFSKESHALFGVHDQIGMCLDLDARRAISIPDEIRAEIEAAALPQYA